MAKKILGIDIGHDQLKLALCRGGKVLRTASASMPENLLREGRIVSPEAMADLLKRTMKENRISANNAALVIPSEVVFVKTIEMPQMTVDQLVYNLPFEFNDYITGEVKDFVFDYAVLDMKEPEPTEGEETIAEDAMPTMELLAVGSPRVVLEDTKTILKKAGLKMVKAAPSICSYIGLIRAQKASLSQVTDEYGILDLGYGSIRMYMFKGDRHVATRVLETGLATLDNVLADIYGVDVHLAHTYLMSNFENCQQKPECRSAYENIAVELMRALNFYRFSNRDSSLTDMWVCGGGAVIRPLVETILDMLDMQLHDADELVPGGSSVPECNTFVQAIGITLD